MKVGTFDQKTKFLIIFNFTKWKTSLRVLEHYTLMSFFVLFVNLGDLSYTSQRYGYQNSSQRYGYQNSSADKRRLKTCLVWFTSLLDVAILCQGDLRNRRKEQTFQQRVGFQRRLWTLRCPVLNGKLWLLIILLSV